VNNVKVMQMRVDSDYQTEKKFTNEVIKKRNLPQLVNRSGPISKLDINFSQLSSPRPRALQPLQQAQKRI